jgi:hypothetical protein
MRKLLLVVAAAAAVSGCATVNRQPIAVAAAKELSGQTVAQTRRPPPDFAAMTAGKAAFALVGAALMISEGNALIASNNVSDPADTIAANLVKALEAAHGARPTEQRIAVSATEVGDIAEAARTAARFVVDVQTINWSFGYFPTDWAHYRVIYAAKARVIDAASKSTVAEGFCKRIPESNANAPTYDELTGNEAARLKKELLIAAEECVKTLKSEMLAL